MELDNFKNTIENLASNDRKLRIDNDSQLFKHRFNRHVWLETLVAIVAMLLVIAALVFGEYWYVRVVESLLPSIATEQLEIHPLMTFSLFLMAGYCGFVMWKLHNANRKPSAWLSSTLKDRVDAEIDYYEKLTNLWSSAHFWSFAPAIVIGVCFFWGLQVSLIGQWWPSWYLLSYFLFVIVSNCGGLWLKNKTINNDIKPILEELYRFKQELRD